MKPITAKDIAWKAIELHEKKASCWRGGICLADKSDTCTKCLTKHINKDRGENDT